MIAGNETSGFVFDIKEFALYDGPGIRTTVFMKGCPLRCQWCHNPEGLSVQPQLMVSPTSCTHCGACQAHCPSPEKCVSCGQCIPYCPLGLRRIAGERYTAQALAQRLLRQRKALESGGGGVTFSGGEPLMQWRFVQAVIQQLEGMHTAIETSAYTTDEIFRQVMDALSLVMMDIKAVDPVIHKHYTGVDNAPILRHVKMLCEGDTPFIIRLPMIPGVNDTPAHYQSVVALLKGAKSLIRVELLPYHQTAGAKYAMVQRAYQVDFDGGKAPFLSTAAFEQAGIPAITL